MKQPHNLHPAAGVFRDPRIRNLHWRDLARPTRPQIFREVLLSLPWLVTSLYCAARGWYLPALALSFVFYLTGLRQVHNAFHNALGLPAWVDTAMMVVLGLLMCNSMHAVKFNHLQHHRHCLDEHDVEGSSAKMPWWKALLLGPLFPIRVHAHALRAGNPRLRRWVWLELALLGAWIVMAFALPVTQVLRYHILAMLAGQCLSAFFCVWTVHHGCEDAQVLGRTLRSKFWNWCSFGMFYHVEHHLFPAVPTCNLGKLAARLDAVAPDITGRRVF